MYSTEQTTPTLKQRIWFCKSCTTCMKYLTSQADLRNRVFGFTGTKKKKKEWVAIFYFYLCYKLTNDINKKRRLSYLLAIYSQNPFSFLFASSSFTNIFNPPLSKKKVIDHKYTIY